MVVAELEEFVHSCAVCGFCGGGNREADEVLQLCSQSSLRDPGVGVSICCACGARKKNLLNCFLDRASAMLLVFPGKCFIVTVKWFLAAAKNSLRSKLMTRGYLDAFPSHAWTMGRLSQ